MDVIIGGLAGEIQVSLLMHERLAENIMAKALCVWFILIPLAGNNITPFI